ncbi:hypothetical protein [Methanospirillum lacunae]|uniref:Uncharacterized protein n=1 Tax=Methanospirillum lacunae TaxID=668570 RepID=A0A2V2N0Z4_9EURY|nr:hypothetical protein [Methanospirillum lacunae]PWR69847.1 hypothetical protein DK846_16860 [Methanospirillum lacunae]
MIGLEVIIVEKKDQMHELTDGVCFPTALLVAKDRSLDIESLSSICHFLFLAQFSFLFLIRLI